MGYGTIDLLCDVGGTLSLLMGASLLTCCELLEVAWIVVAKKCCRKVSRTLQKGKKSTKKSLANNPASTGPPPLHLEHDQDLLHLANAAKLQTKV